MRDSATTDPKRKSPIARIAWVLAGAICLFAVENIWIDPWVARRSHHKLQSFVPETLGGTWFFVLLALGATLTLAVFCQVMLMRNTRVAGREKALTGAGVLAAAILASEWFVATGGMSLFEPMRSHRKDHKVTLTWQTSATKNVRYNIYRGRTRGFHPDKLNSSPIDGLTFVDTRVDSRGRYYYVARAVDASGLEGSDSNEVFANVP